MTTVAHPRAAESAAWPAVQLLLLTGLTAALGLGPLGWAVGACCVAATFVLPGRAVRPSGRLGPADRITPGRAMLVGCVAALVWSFGRDVRWLWVRRGAHV